MSKTNSKKADADIEKVDNKATTSNKQITHIIKVTLLILGSVTLILCLTAYIVFKIYINKMNLVTTSENSTTEVSELDQVDSETEGSMAGEGSGLEEESELDSNQPDSSKEEIASLEESIRKNMEESSTPIQNNKNVLNILLIGKDSRKSGGTGRSDAMILVSINKKAKKIIATSILRDIYLQIPGEGSNRINAAYAYGGADLLLETIEQNFKIKVDRYAAVDFYAFMDIVDAVGGVNIDVTSEEMVVLNDYVRAMNSLTNQDSEQDILTTPGTSLLNGKQALCYVRNRYVGNADFDRTARQRKVLEQIYNRVKKLGLLELNDLMNIILPQVTTNLTEGEILSLILSLPTYTGYDIEQWSVPIKDSYTFLSIRGMSVIGIDFEENIDEMNNKIYGN